MTTKKKAKRKVEAADGYASRWLRSQGEWKTAWYGRREVGCYIAAAYRAGQRNTKRLKP
jgi:hypothetical protein